MTTPLDDVSSLIAVAPIAPERAAVPEHAAGPRLFGTHRGSGYRIPPSLVRRADGQSSS